MLICFTWEQLTDYSSIQFERKIELEILLNNKLIQVKYLIEIYFKNMCYIERYRGRMNKKSQSMR